MSPPWFLNFHELLRRNTVSPRQNRSMHYALAIILIVAVSLANLAVDLVFVRHVRQVAVARDPPLTEYSFIEDDYPPRLPLFNARPSGVVLALEESVRYDPAHLESPLEWASASANGDANVRLSPLHRFFNPAFSYELHCLRVVVTTLKRDGQPLAPGRERAHVERCLNVLRQFALCDADATLEPADALERDFARERVGGERRCKDWPAVYETIAKNWEDWKQTQQTMENA